MLAKCSLNRFETRHIRLEQCMKLWNFREKCIKGCLIALQYIAYYCIKVGLTFI